MATERMGLPRLKKELAAMKATNIKGLTNLKVNEANLFQWTGLIVPECVPYNNGAFKIQIDFPDRYPFQPPKITFLTKIYHPNIDENGKMCFEKVSPETWRPATKMEEVIKTVVQLVNEPQVRYPMRPDVAEEFLRRKTIFMKKAKEETAKHGEKRP